MGKSVCGISGPHGLPVPRGAPRRASGNSFWSNQRDAVQTLLSCMKTGERGGIPGAASAKDAESAKGQERRENLLMFFRVFRAFRSWKRTETTKHAKSAKPGTELTMEWSIKQKHERKLSRAKSFASSHGCFPVRLWLCDEFFHIVSS